MSKSEMIDRFFASLLLHAQLTGNGTNLTMEELTELLEAVNAESEPLMSTDQYLS